MDEFVHFRCGKKYPSTPQNPSNMNLENIGTYHSFRQLDLLVLGVSSWWKWTSQSNLFWRKVLDLNRVMVSNIFYFHPHLGRWTHFDSYFSNGLKPPTSKDIGWNPRVTKNLSLNLPEKKNTKKSTRSTQKLETHWIFLRILERFWPSVAFTKQQKIVPTTKHLPNLRCFSIIVLQPHFLGVDLVFVCIY